MPYLETGQSLRNGGSIISVPIRVQPFVTAHIKARDLYFAIVHNDACCDVFDTGRFQIKFAVYNTATGHSFCSRKNFLKTFY